MSGFTKKDQDKSLFTVKKDSQGNTIVMRASGENGGEIRGSILRTNEAKPFLVPGKGIKINSGSKSEGYPGPGQVELSINVSEIAGDIQAVASRLGLTGTAGPRGATGATGAQGARGPAGDTGPAGAPGPPGADGTDGVNGTNGTNGTNGVDGEDGEDGFGLAPGDYYSFSNNFKIVNDTLEYPSVVSGSVGWFGGSFGTPPPAQGWTTNTQGDPPMQEFAVGYAIHDGSVHNLSTLNKSQIYSVNFTHYYQDNNVASVAFECRWRIRAIKVGEDISTMPPLSNSSTGNPVSFYGQYLEADSQWENNQHNFDPSPNTGPPNASPASKYLVFLSLEIAGSLPPGAQSEVFDSRLIVSITDAEIQTKYTVPP